MESRKKELLEALEAELKTDDSIGEMSVFSAKELNVPMDILRAEVTGFGPDLVSVLGEFFFFPFEDENTLYFTTVITLSSTVPAEAAPDLAGAVARLNYYLPCGCFALGAEDKNLVYRYTALLDAADKKEDQIKDIIRTYDIALGVADRFYPNLLLVIRNEMTVSEMMDSLLK